VLNLNLLQYATGLDARRGLGSELWDNIGTEVTGREDCRRLQNLCMFFVGNAFTHDLSGLIAIQSCGYGDNPVFDLVKIHEEDPKQLDGPLLALAKLKHHMAIPPPPSFQKAQRGHVISCTCDRVTRNVGLLRSSSILSEVSG
jgi:hypothetical protein